jgi:broad specificity phosphatase PhoE
VRCADFGLVLVARHGQTEWNERGRRQGQLDSPLTSLGVQQAMLLARAVAQQPGIDGVFSSPLQRAVSTATECGMVLDLPVVVIEELTEVHHGVMAGLTAMEIEARFPGEMSRRNYDKYRWRFPGGESYADADARAAAAIDKIASCHARCPLIVTHEMIGRMLMRHLVATTPAVALEWSHPQEVLYKIDPVQRTRTSIRVGTVAGFR